MATTADEIIQASQRLTSPLYWEIRSAIRKAISSDEYADLAGEPGMALCDLKSDLQDAIIYIDEILNHHHDWNEDDYCGVCGADGRA